MKTGNKKAWFPRPNPAPVIDRQEFNMKIKFWAKIAEIYKWNPTFMNERWESKSIKDSIINYLAF